MLGKSALKTKLDLILVFEPLGELANGIAIKRSFFCRVFVADFGKGFGLTVWDVKEIMPTTIVSVGFFCDGAGASVCEYNWLFAWFAVGEAMFDAGFAVSLVRE